MMREGGSPNAWASASIWRTPIEEIAAALCYADVSAFTRAFRRWTGTTPAQWRKDAGRPKSKGCGVRDGRYSHVMHIVSNVEGKLKPGLDAIAVLRGTFPAGTLSGAPKVRAMEIIEELEPSKRGVYAGAVGYLGFNGDMDLAIAIRTHLGLPARAPPRAPARPLPLFQAT